MAEFLLGITNDISDISKGLKSAKESISVFNKGLKETEAGVGKLGTTFSGTAKSALGFAQALAGLAEVGAKIGAVVTIANAAYDTFKKLKGVSEGLTFAEAISGSQELSNNIKFLEDVSNPVFDGLKKSVEAAFNPAAIRQWQGQSVKAFAEVEQAAYRLSTITVTGQEKSIDAVGRNIKAMRELQKEVNYSVDSVTLLNAQYDIASAGFASSKDSKNVGKASVNLSQAGFGDLGGSANALVKTLRALGDGSEAAEKRAAQLFETTKVGLLTLDQLSSEAGSLAVQSKQLGLSFDEVLSALAGLTTQGFSASEAATRLQAFFSEVANASTEANTSLASFRDEAGKPIQLNATSLKEKGIQGIIKDLKTATKGDLPKIQQLFSRQETSEAVSGLISLGDKNFGDYTQQIKGAEGGKLDTEAKGRGQTLIGAYQKGVNESQKAIEDLGQSLSAEAISKLLVANELVGKLTTGSAEFVGKLSGGIASASEKIQAIGGFLATAFTTVAPFAIFAVLKKFQPVIEGAVKKVLDLKKSFDSLGGEGATVWDKMKIAADKVFTYLVKRIDSLVQQIRDKLKEVRAIADQELEGGGSSPSQGSAKDIFQPPQNNDPNTRKNVKNNIVPLQKNAAGDLAGELGKIEGAGNKLGGVFSKVKGAAGGLFNIVKGGGGLLTQVFGEAVGMLKGLGAAAILATGAFQVFSGLASTAWLAFNKGAFLALPEVQELRDTLKDINGIPAISQLAKDLDPVTANLSTGNDLVDSITQGAKQLGQVWSFVTGQTAKSNMILDQYDKAIDSLATENVSTAYVTKNQTGKTGFVDAQSADAKNAQRKLRGGTELTADDRKALEDDLGNKKKQLDAEVSLRKKKIEEIEKSNNADYSAEDVANLKLELQMLEKQTEVRKKNLELEYKKALLLDQVRKFQAIDTSKPLQGQLIEQQEGGIKSQIQDVAKTYADAVSGALNDPAKFEGLSNNVSSILDSINVQIALDPGSAQKLRNDLLKSVPDIDKLIFSNPQLRQKLAELNKSITSERVSNTQNVENARTSVIGTAEGLGSQSTVDSSRKYKATIDSITEQSKALNEELSRPETTLARQKEIMAQLEELESKRLNASVENRVKTELNARKQQLTVAQTLFSIEQARINLYQIEGDNTLLAISGAQQRLAAAKEELAIKQEQTKIAGREDSIKKEEIQKALESQADRESNNNTKLEGQGDQSFTGGSTGSDDSGSTQYVFMPDSSQQNSNASGGEITAASDTAFTKTIESLRGKFENLDKVVEIVKLGVEAEFAARTKNIQQTKNLGDSFAQLGQTASTLFSSSALGSQLQAIGKNIANPMAEVLNTSRKQLAQIDAVVKADQEIYNQITQELTNAKANGADSATIEKLTAKQAEAGKRVQASSGEASRDKEYIKQKTIVQALNAQLDQMQSEVAAATEAMQKQADVAKDSIDFEQRKKDNAAENNRSGVGLQSAFLGFLGKNNPMTAMLQQRLDYQQAEDDATLQKSKNVTEAKKEVIDMTVLNSQLELEQQSYENALTQTMLLTDISNLLQGRETQFSGTASVEQELAKLPDKIAASRSLAAERKDLVQQKLDYIPQELQMKNQAVDRDKLSKQLGSLGGNLNPGNIDLIDKTLRSSQSEIQGFRRQNISVGSLGDSDFQDRISRIQAAGSGISGGDREALRQNAAQATANNRNALKNGLPGDQGQIPGKTQSTGKAVNVQAPVNIALNINGEDAKKLAGNTQAFTSLVGKTVNDALEKLSKDVLSMTKNY